jgi:hypothetical protein
VVIVGVRGRGVGVAGGCVGAAVGCGGGVGAGGATAGSGFAAVVAVGDGAEAPQAARTGSDSALAVARRNARRDLCKLCLSRIDGNDQRGQF